MKTSYPGQTKPATTLFVTSRWGDRPEYRAFLSAATPCPVCSHSAPRGREVCLQCQPSLRPTPVTVGEPAPSLVQSEQGAPQPYPMSQPSAARF